MNASQVPVSTRVRRGLLIGAGYFSDFHLDAWQRLPGANIVCVCDLDASKARRAADKYGIADVTTNIDEALQRADLDFVDIATPPAGRLEVVRQVTARGLPMICQKPLADDFRTAGQIIELAQTSGLTFMVHENFRFQPWYREIKCLLNSHVIGRRLHMVSMRTRLGDGWGADAYLARQPYFRSMPRLLMHETGVHFVDTFRYLAGEIVECSGDLLQLNPAIAGEDAGTMRVLFESGARGVWDANRYNETLADNPRYTFGELLVEAEAGSLWLDAEGTITVKPLGQPAYQHEYQPSRLGFGGDCVRACQQHFLDVLDGSLRCETSPTEYLKTLQVVEAVYDSARRHRPVGLAHGRSSSARRDCRVVDLSLPVSSTLRGVSITPAKSLETDGWNATTLALYSHAGTHMDAPRHFLPEGASLDQQDLAVCCGPARVVDLAPANPRQLHTVEDIVAAIGQVYPGDRLLLRTDWHKHYGMEAYREELPRISLDLAKWLVARQVALIGVEPPSVADVNNMRELTEVHRALFQGGVLIVEGLANLDQLTLPEVEFIALPLRIVGGDGCPVRAIAIEERGVST